MSDGAITSIVTGLVTVVTIIGGVITLWLKLKYGEDKVTKVEAKLDDNTNITRSGTAAAAVNASIAATAASEAKSVVDNIDRKLNGGIDATIYNALAPIRKAIEDHAVLDDKNMKEINAKFDQLTERVHRSNHDLLNTLQLQASKIEALLQIVNRE